MQILRKGFILVDEGSITHDTLYIVSMKLRLATTVRRTLHTMLLMSTERTEERLTIPRSSLRSNIDGQHLHQVGQPIVHQELVVFRDTTPNLSFLWRHVHNTYVV